jgi:DNA-binding HxlR family transcriptional regulator
VRLAGRATVAPANAPVELALEVPGGKWRVVIFARLKEKALRYGDARRLVPRMNEKMLTQRLKELVDAGLICRRAGSYTLTARGESARTVLEALYAWGPPPRTAARRADRSTGSP